MSCPFQANDKIAVFATPDELADWLKNHGVCKHILQFIRNCNSTMPAGAAYFRYRESPYYWPLTENSDTLCDCLKPDVLGFFAWPRLNKNDIIYTAAHEMAHCILGQGHTSEQERLSGELYMHMLACQFCQKRLEKIMK